MQLVLNIRFARNILNHHPFLIGTARRTLLGFDLASKADVFRVDYFEVQMGHCNVANGCIVAELSFDILVPL